MIDQLKKKLSNPDSLVSLFLGIAVIVVIGTLIVNYIKGRTPTAQVSEENKKTEQSTTIAEATYTVAAGDTLWSIAQKTIGSGFNWVDIRDANKLADADRVEIGQTLTIPHVAKRELGQIANATVEVKRPADGKYTVQKGDTLWNIAVSVYGTGFRWNEIAQLNKLEHPNVIHTGNILLLP